MPLEVFIKMDTCRQEILDQQVSKAYSLLQKQVSSDKILKSIVGILKPL